MPLVVSIGNRNVRVATFGFCFNLTDMIPPDVPFSELLIKSNSFSEFDSLSEFDQHGFSQKLKDASSSSLSQEVIQVQQLKKSLNWFQDMLLVDQQVVRLKSLWQFKVISDCDHWSKPIASWDFLNWQE